MAKQDDLSVTHLQWLVNSRAANQQAAIKILDLLQRHLARMHEKTLTESAHSLVAVCFSMWRAAFLADKTGMREAVIEDAIVFLGKMITDNAITYAQDRSSREWTFNYYMNCARDGLLFLARRWPAIDKSLNRRRGIPKGSTREERRWDRHHAALETAIQCLAQELEGTNAKAVGGGLQQRDRGQW
jgi:hypothetical protein